MLALYETDKSDTFTAVDMNVTRKKEKPEERGIEPRTVY